jgi:hypothetical protein
VVDKLKYPPARKPKVPDKSACILAKQKHAFIGHGENNNFEGVTDLHVIDINVELEFDAAKGNGRPVDY